MDKKLITVIASSVLATSVLGVTNIKPVKADAPLTSQSQATYKNLLSGDSGLGDARSAFGLTGTGINNYEAIATGNTQHLYMPTATTEVFNLALNTNFKNGGTINLSPDDSNNAGSKIPLIINQVYAYNSSNGNKALIYSADGSSVDRSESTVNKSGTNYSINVPKDGNISNYILVFTVSPLNSNETSSNSYQHPSYGVYVDAKSNDGYVDGSGYSSVNGGFGVLWGQFDYSTPVQLKTNQASINTGDNFDLNNQVKNASDYTSSKWVLRDANGNTINSTNINELKAGTYYATYYGSYQGTTTKYAWDTIQLTITDKPVSSSKGSGNTSTSNSVSGFNSGSSILANPNSSTNTSSNGISTNSSNSSSNTSSANSSNSSSNSSSSSIGTNIPSSTNNASNSSSSSNKASLFKPFMAYSIKATGLYKNYKFNKSGLIKWFAKAKRTNRPVFKVIAKQGQVYKVISYNKGTYKKVGYVNKANLANLYYSSGNYHSNGVYVIDQKGINSYSKLNLKSKVKHYKFGNKLIVNKLVKKGLVYRFQLTNGNYITANKKLIEMGGYGK